MEIRLDEHIDECPPTLRSCGINRTIFIAVCHTYCHHSLHFSSIFLGAILCGLIGYGLDYGDLWLCGCFFIDMFIAFGLFFSGCIFNAFVLSLPAID